MLFSTPEGAEECERRTREVGGGREPSIPFFPQIAKYIKKNVSAADDHRKINFRCHFSLLGSFLNLSILLNFTF